jgi:sugar (pentulose or hexulose) kinase
MYKMQVSTLKIADAAILGAAIFAGTGSGIFNSIIDGVKKMVTTDKTYKPGKDKKVYDNLYDIYVNAYMNLNNGKIFKNLSDFQRNY